MQIQSTRCAFGAKNTYLSQAEKAISKDDKKKFLSYHYEAKARANYIKFLHEESKLDKLSEEVGLDDLDLRGWFNLFKIISGMVYRKLASVDNISRAYRFDPKRFEN